MIAFREIKIPPRLGRDFFIWSRLRYALRFGAALWDLPGPEGRGDARSQAHFLFLCGEKENGLGCQKKKSLGVL